MALTRVTLTDDTPFYFGVIDSTGAVLEEGTILFVPPGEQKEIRFKYPGYNTTEYPIPQSAAKFFSVGIRGEKNPLNESGKARASYHFFHQSTEISSEYDFSASSVATGGGDFLIGLCLDITGAFVTVIYRQESSTRWLHTEVGALRIENVVDLSLESGNGPGGEPSGPGGGDGTLDETSDPIDFPTPPALSASATGLVTLYSPSIGQLRSLAEFMWSDAFDLDTFKKLFADPMEVIIGLSIVPVQPNIVGSQNIKVGFVDTGVTCNLIDSQYITVNCGSINISEYWGTALDYSPYTKFSIYLPFIGTRELKTDDIMKRTITVQYLIDVLSGACTACVKCGESVLYQYSGSCASTIPITGQNWGEMITSVIQLAGAGIAAVATGGAGAAGLIPSSANAIASMKPSVQRAGAVSGAAGMLGIQRPYLIWEHPKQSLATGYNKFVGYPSNITEGLSTLTGFTQIESIHLEGIPATQMELMEIEDLLKRGVIL